MQERERQLERINLVLRVIRNVNQLLVKGEDRFRLIQGICDTLVEDLSYYNAWIALFDESGGLVTTAEAGLGKEFLPMIEQLKQGELTDCCNRRSNFCLQELSFIGKILWQRGGNGKVGAQ